MNLSAASWPELLKTETAKLMKMEMKQDCKSEVVENIPVLRCFYKTSEKLPKKARVTLIDISQERWMNWIGNACNKVKSKVPHLNLCYIATVKQIRTQSGGQIPWTGLVYEDMKQPAGLEAYCFRNGISIRMDGWKKWSTHQLSEDEMNLCETSDKINFIGHYPRPISFSIDEYIKLHGNKNFKENDGTNTVIWLEEVETILMNSFANDENAFINYWVEANVKKMLK
jgi:hypothetical protein